jgi:hypothetical protein
MMTEFRTACSDLNFWAVGDLIAEGDYVVGRWDGGRPCGVCLPAAYASWKAQEGSV